MQNLFYQHCYSLFHSALSPFVYNPSKPLTKMYKPSSFKQQFTVTHFTYLRKQMFNLVSSPIFFFSVLRVLSWRSISGRLVHCG